MEKYRKTDQEYIDDYDRHTIEWLKKLERESPTPIYYDRKADRIDLQPQYNPLTLFYDKAVKSSREKDEIIRKRKQRDENRDWLLAKTTPPKNIKCKTCDTFMNVCSHTFEENDTKLLFFFECPNGHFPRRLFYSKGTEYFFPEKRCSKCNHRIESKSVKKKKVLITTETCEACGDINIIELNLVIKPVKPIDEKDRKKYCTDFIGSSTIADDLLKLKHLDDRLKERETKEEREKVNGVDKIENLTLPKMEKRLAEACEKCGFCKFVFDKPETGRFFIVPFSVQDPSDRNEDNSIKELINCIKKSVFPTNWRLMSTQVTYRLGLISGKLKAHEDEEGLIKIGQEILAKPKS